MAHKEIRWTKLALICAAALIVFFAACRQVGASMEELRAQEESLAAQLRTLTSRQEELAEEKAQVGTESYIEDRARTDYQYVMPGELRFEIVNPGALYDGQAETGAQANE